MSRSKVAPEAAALPLYAAIERRIAAAIVSGLWGPGHRVPSEAELCAEYGCARMTVNKALSRLVAAGMIVRRRRAGSYVAPAPLQEPVLQIRDIQAEVSTLGQRYSFRILSRSVWTVRDDGGAGPLPAERAPMEAGTPVLSLELLHCADDTPFVRESRHISLAVVPEAALQDFSLVPPGTWLLAQIAWHEAEHAIRAIALSAGPARDLAVPRGTACLSVTRRTWKEGRLVTSVDLIYPGETHRFVARFTPRSG